MQQSVYARGLHPEMQKCCFPSFSYTPREANRSILSLPSLISLSDPSSTSEPSEQGRAPPISHKLGRGAPLPIGDNCGEWRGEVVRSGGVAWRPPVGRGEFSRMAAVGNYIVVSKAL